MQHPKKIYFASDFHLGSYPSSASQKREQHIIAWLDYIKQDASSLFLVGDIFDFWFEYKTVVPKGYIRFFGKLAELSDSGIKIYLFKGNHDMWMFDYFEKELNATIISDEFILEDQGKRFYIHHGDGLGPGDKSYKFLKKIFRNKLCIWLFERLHPNLGIGIASRWSKHSRIANNEDEKFLGEDQEWLIQYARQIESATHFDYYIFGHRHLPYDVKLNEHSTIINLGEWINFQTFAVWDGQSLILKQWNENHSILYKS